MILIIKTLFKKKGDLNNISIFYEAIGIINADDKKIKRKVGVEISDDELKSFDK
jgi:hypothetical protein